MRQKPHLRPLATDAQEHATETVVPKHAEDWRLVQDCIHGKRAQWAELLKRHERTLFFAVLNTLRSWSAHAPRDRVEDIQSDIVVELVKNDFAKLRKYSGRCRLAQWLKVVASNYTIDMLRKQRPTISLSDTTETSRALRSSLPSKRIQPDDHLQRQQLLKALRGLYSELPHEDQRFVELFYAKEHTFEKIAELMNTTIGAVYARKNRVRKKLLKLAQDRGLTAG